MSTLARVESSTFRCPIATPVRTSFGTMTERVGVFVRAEDTDGAHGWGEIWSNFPAASAEHRALLLDTVIAPRYLGTNIADPAAIWAEGERGLHVLRLQSGDQGALSAAAAGLDLALHDLRARKANLPLWQALGGTNPAPVPAYASGLNPGPGAHDLVIAARARGHRAFKIKLGFGRESDLATMRPIAAGLAASEQIMVDINQGWTVAEACFMADKLREFPLAWIEEPLAADRPDHEWAQVAAAAQAPLAAGENLRGLGAFQHAIDAGALSILQPDAAKWGGATACLHIAKAALLAGKSYCPHFLGGAIGLIHSLHLLAAVRGPGLLEVDFNANPLRETLLDTLLTLHHGTIALPTAPGLGFEPDLARLAKYRTLHTDRAA
jgi:L-alanine-DL-glutamate epimerase-like enolase superfamily enzyme